MRIEQLDLVAFGHFSGTSLDFADHGLQIVYGPNEAGKTTVRAAILRLLFGFPHRDGFGYLHPQNTLQIAARVTGSDGTGCDVVRHKRRTATLVDRSTAAPVGDEQWGTVIGGLREADFTAMFTLGGDELRQGTEDLLASGGALGQALFSAGFGRAVSPVLRQLAQEADDLYRPRGQNQVVNAAVRRFREAQKSASELSLPPRHYDELRRRRDRASKHLDSLRVAASQKARRRNELAALRAVVPLLRQHQDLVARRQRLTDEGTTLPASWADNMTKILDEHAQLLGDHRRLSDERDARAQRLAASTVDDTILAMADSIDAVNTAIGAYEEGQRDRSGLERGIGEAETVVVSIVTELLGPTDPPSALDTLRPILGTLERAAAARDRWSACQQDRKAAEQAVADVQDEIERLRHALATTPNPLDSRTLQVTVDQARRAGEADTALDAARRERLAAADAVAAAAVAVGIAPGEAETAVRRPAPSNEEIEELLAAVEQQATAASTADQQAADCDSKQSQLQAELDDVTGEGDLPTEAELADVRHQRDRAWEAARLAWLGHRQMPGPDGPTVDSPRSDSPVADQLALADDVTRGIDEADRIVDRLWHEAGRTARRASLQDQLARLTDDRRQFIQRAEAARAAAAQRFRTWRQQWPDQNLPDRPEGLRRWAQDFGELRHCSRQWHHADHNHRQAYRTVVRHRLALSRQLADYQVLTPPGNELRPVLERAEQLLAQLDQDRKARAVDEQLLAEAERGLPKKQRSAAAAAEAEVGARGEVLSLLGPFAARAGSATEAGAVVERLRSAAGHLQQRDGKADRIAGIDARARQFEAKVAELVASVPDVVGQPPALAARTLVVRLRAATEASAARKEAADHLDQAQQALDHVGRQLVALSSTRAALADEYGLDDDPESLRATVARSMELAELDATIADIEGRILTEGHGATVAQLHHETRDWELHTLDDAIGQLDREIDDLNEQQESATEELTDATAEFRQIDGSDRAANQAQLAEEALGDALGGADRYIRLVLARHIADVAIAQYRQAHENPLLASTSTYLCRLTEGRYRRAVADTSAGAARLLAVDAGGQELTVAQLSEGTRDQLYLALRLAAITEAAARGQRMPVLLDDVLVNFDDHRVDAALACLDEVAKLTQVLLFTHHGHVLDHARRILGDRAGICVLADRPAGPDAPLASTRSLPAQEVPR